VTLVKGLDAEAPVMLVRVVDIEVVGAARHGAAQGEREHQPQAP
jgi:hypothetical protein